MAAIFDQAFTMTATLDKAVRGFASCGLWPYDTNVFTEEDYVVSHVNDETQPATADDLSNDVATAAPSLPTTTVPNLLTTAAPGLPSNIRSAKITTTRKRKATVKTFIRKSRKACIHQTQMTVY